MEPFIGEIRMFGGNFAPRGWTFCDGQLLTISGNETLFALIGTTYGGDGRTTFGLPDFRGRAVSHQGQGIRLSERRMGQTFGTEEVTLTEKQLPAHTHAVKAHSSPGNLSNPTNGYWASGPPYSNTPPSETMKANLVSNAGGSLPHENMAPTLVTNFIIALVGLFPPRP